MSTNKSFALLGFLPDAESELKTLVQQHIQYEVSWVTATDPDLQGVIINADFISSPQIQKYIQRVNANIVCCFHDAEGQKEAEQLGIIGMALNHRDHASLQQWLNHLVGEEVELDSRVLTLLDNNTPTTPANTVTDDISASAKKASDLNTPQTDTPPAFARAPSEPKKSSNRLIQTSTQTTGTPTANEQTAHRDFTLSDLTFHDECDTLLAKLQQNDGYYLIQYGDKYVWADLAKNDVYLDFERDQISGIENARWATLPNLDGKGQARRLQLELWLFETLWQSDSVHGDNVHDDGLYKLSRWPRPLCAQGRSEALRLAAFIQSDSATVSQLCTKTGYDDTMVSRFLNAAITVGQVKQTGIVEQQAEPLSVEPKKVDDVKLGLIGRLRTRLGL